MRAFFTHPTVITAIVALVGLAWNAMLYFLVREQMDPVAALTLTDDYRAFIDNRLIWELVAANVTYIAGLAGAILLVAARKISVWLFGVSAITAALTVIPTFVMGPFIIGMFMLVATLLALVFTWFARRSPSVTAR